MSRKWLIFPIVLIVLASLALGRSILGARAAAEQQIDPTLPRRETQDVPGMPSISFIDDPSPTCYLPKPGTGVCYISMNYLYVSASSSQYIISMTLAIDDQIQSYNAGFFQTSMYIPGEMFGPGFKVNCGLPGASGVDTLGKTYSFTVRARETGGLGSANYGSVTCPADVVKIFLPVIERP